MKSTGQMCLDTCNVFQDQQRICQGTLYSNDCGEVKHMGESETIEQGRNIAKIIYITLNEHEIGDAELNLFDASGKQIVGYNNVCVRALYQRAH